MVAQVAYEINTDQAYVGMLADLTPSEIVSRSVEGAAGIGFGLAVSRGTDKDNQVVIGGSDYLGVTVRELSREGAINSGDIKYDETETAAIIRDGYIFAICPTGCIPGAIVNYNTTTGVLDSGAAGGGEVQLNGSNWESTTSAGDIGLIRLNDAEVNVNANVELLVIAEVTAADLTSGVGECAIQLTDGFGTNLTEPAMVEVWWSSSAEFGVPADIGDETLVTGTQIQELLANAHYKYLSDASGVVNFTVLMDTPGNIWFMVSIDGKITTDTVTVTS